MTKATITLSPLQAANTANDSYLLEYNLVEPAKAFKNVKDEFDFSGPKGMQGKSGATFYQVISGFAALGKGRSGQGGSGRFDKHAILAVRGTGKAIDWLSDFHGGTSPSTTSGHIVHSGFNKIYKSFDTVMSAQLSALYPGEYPTHLHCVGHSMGGAVAALAAEWAQARGIQPVLYTFGSPRTGSKPFAKNLTEKIGKDNMYRCYRTWDPVPHVPVWPFMHHPLVDPDGIHLPSEAILASHSMPGGYLQQLKGYSNPGYDSLIASSRAPDYRAIDWDNEMRQWNDSRTILNTLVPITNPRTFIIILKAIGRILQRAMYVAGLVLGAAAGGVSNTLDLIAMILEKAAAMNKWIFSEIQFMLYKMLTAAGFVFDKTKAMTKDFIRWIFNQFLTILYRFVRTAVSSQDDGNVWNPN
jgi:hypothetical protein